MNQDFIQDLLEQNPETSFFSFVNQLNNPQRRHFRGQFGNIRNQFLGMLGSQLREGQLPTQKFTNFLGDFNFDERFRSLAPSLRGQGDRSRFAPPTTFRL